MFYGNVTSYEYVALQLNSSYLGIFLNIYRLPKYCVDFFDGLVELLSFVCTDFDWC